MTKIINKHLFQRCRIKLSKIINRCVGYSLPVAVSSWVFWFAETPASTFLTAAGRVDEVTPTPLADPGGVEGHAEGTVVAHSALLAVDARRVVLTVQADPAPLALAEHVYAAAVTVHLAVVATLPGVVIALAGCAKSHTTVLSGNQRATPSDQS